MFRITPEHTEISGEELTKLAKERITQKYYLKNINDKTFKLLIKILILMTDATIHGALEYKKLKKFMVPTHFGHTLISKDKDSGQLITTEIEVKITCIVEDPQ